MEPEVLEKYKKAGKICSDIRKEITLKLRPGAKILDIAEEIDRLIAAKGGKPAFPVNISINDRAAHYTPAANDETEIGRGDLVKIDIGAHVDGYIGDMAWTYCSEENKLVRTAEACLKKAIKIIRPGVTIGELGTVIEETAEKAGCGVITNLTGHTLGKYEFHGSPSIPNVRNDLNYKFEEGRFIALEPFVAATTSQIRESGTNEIYKYVMDRPVRLTEARTVLAMARDEWHGLPFAKRWLYKKISPIKVALALRQLENLGALETYPVLKDIEGKPIAQSEHTIIVGDPPVVTTE